jgi:hypothetical protein
VTRLVWRWVFKDGRWPLRVLGVLGLLLLAIRWAGA